MDQLMYTSLSHTHYLLSVLSGYSMLEVVADCTCISLIIMVLLIFTKILVAELCAFGHYTYSGSKDTNQFTSYLVVTSCLAWNGTISMGLDHKVQGLVL